ncbi:MAG: TRAP transporter substrate-binding protein DctP [Pseudomonadota bacterium]
MNNTTHNPRGLDFTPLVILLLSAAPVLMAGLFAWEKSKHVTLETVGAQHAVNSTAGATAVNNAANAVATETIEWKLATSWPKNFPGLGMAPEYLAEKVNAMSNGRLKITVFGANEIVPPLGVFDAVSNGSVQAGHSGAYYWKGKIPASVFFTTIPFGMNAQETNAWLYEGGGLELWREIYAKHNLVPFPGGNTGVQMGGWFNKSINSLSDLKGMRMRIPGLGGEVFKRIGGEPVNIPGGELFTSLKSGVIDGTEWVGPYNDLTFGFHKIASHYYYPGWHEPGANLEFIINKAAWDALPADLQSIVDVATQAVNQQLLNEYTARNNKALQQLVTDHKVTLSPFPKDVLTALKQASETVMNELVSSDADAKRVYESYRAFSQQVQQYHDVSEVANYRLRD